MNNEKGPATVETDTYLITRFREGDEQAFDTLVRRHQQMVYFLALRLLQNEAEAADVAQNVFVKVYKKISGFKGRSSFRTWLYRITVNQCRSQWRSINKISTVTLEEVNLLSADSPENNLLQQERKKKLAHEVSQLPTKERLVLSLRLWEGLPYQEIAQVLGISVNAAKVNYHYALKRLRRILADSEV